MIEWEKVQDDISKILGEDNRVGLIDAATNPGAITHYIKELIAKEFKLVAKGKVAYLPGANGSLTSILTSPQIRQDKLEEYNGKNIGIYISEE